MFLILLIFLFLRPFISSLGFPEINYLYSILFLGFLPLYIIMRKGISAPAIKPIKFPLLAFILALFASVAFSVDKITSLQELYKYATAILLFSIGLSSTGAQRKRIIFSILAAGSIIFLMAIYQYFWGFRNLAQYIAQQDPAQVSDFTKDYISRRRVFSPFVTPNALGGYLAMLIPLALMNKKTLWLTLPLSFALLLTKSLGAITCLFLGLIIYFALKGGPKKGKIILLTGFLIFIATLFMLRMGEKQHLQPTFSTLMRLGYWKDTLAIIKQSPLFGIGIGNFNLTQARFAHNSYLQLAAEIGIPGLLCLLWLIGTVVISGIKRIGNATDKGLLVGLFAAATVFLLHNFVDFTFFLPEVALLWWVILGA